MWFGAFLIFVAVPLLELALLIKVGQSIGFWSTMAIIVVTADASPTTARKILALGVERYVTKPIDVAALFDAIVAVTR